MAIMPVSTLKVHEAKVMLCWILNRDIFEALCQLYNRKESSMIYCMASIRACYPGTRNYQMGDRYDQSTLSNQFKDVDLSKNNVSQELKNLGMEYSRIRKFMRDRVAKMKENSTILVDGCLLQNHSRVDTLSQVSRKTRLRKHKDSLMIFAYDPDAKEPICSKLYPENVVDSRAIGDFVRDNKIERGIIVADKGFTLSAVLDAIGDKKELHYLLPLKDDSKLITANGMYDFDSSFFYENTIECKKPEFIR